VPEQQNEQHRDLVTHLGGDFARSLLETLPRIVKALKAGQKRATFAATVHFDRTPNDELQAVLQPREHVPLTRIVRKVAIDGNQLALFQGTPRVPLSAPEAEPVPTTDEAKELNAEGDSAGEVLARLGISSDRAALIIETCGARDSTVADWLEYVSKQGIAIENAVRELLA
jgi:hypothetical protein